MESSERNEEWKGETGSRTLGTEQGGNGTKLVPEEARIEEREARSEERGGNASQLGLS